jgi:parallel beta-helix repeat protein
LPAYGFYCRYVDGISFSNVTLNFVEPELRPAIFCEEVKDLRIDALDAQYWIPKSQYTAPLETGEACIVLNQVQQAVVRNTAAPMTSPLVDIRGAKSTDIILTDNDLRLCQVVPYAIDPIIDGWVTIEPQAEIDVEELHIPEISAGVPSEIAAHISNVGDPGFFHIDLAINGMLADRKWGWIGKGQKKTVELDAPQLFEDKDYRITVGQKTCIAGIEPKKAKLALRDLDIPTIGAVGQGLPVRVHIQNIGSYALEEILELHEGERTLASRQIRVGPGESETVVMFASFPAPGQYTVAVGQLSASVSVNPVWIDGNTNGVIDAGEQSFVQLEDALTAAESGDVIMVSPGRFQIDSSALPLIVDKPNLTIRSVEGYNKTIIEAVNANEEDYEGHALFSVTANGVIIEGFTLKLGVYNVYVENAKDVQIRNNYFNTSRRYHIYMVESSNVKIANNRSRVGRYNFLTTVKCTGCLVEGNYHFEDPCGYMLRDSHGNTIKDNHFDSLSWYGVSLDNSNNNLVENNLFEGSRICGLQMRGTSVGNRIIRNTFIDNRTEAVLITGGSRENEVTQNNILNNRGLAVTNESWHMLDAAKNWWGSADGPGGIGPGSGDTVDKNVNFSPWLKSPAKNSWTSHRMQR